MYAMFSVGVFRCAVVMRSSGDVKLTSYHIIASRETDWEWDGNGVRYWVSSTLFSSGLNSVGRAERFHRCYVCSFGLLLLGVRFRKGLREGELGTPIPDGGSDY